MVAFAEDGGIIPLSLAAVVATVLPKMLKPPVFSVEELAAGVDPRVTVVVVVVVLTEDGGIVPLLAADGDSVLV